MRAATPGQPKNRERSGLPHGGGGEPPALPGRQCRTFVRSSSHRSFLCVVADAVRKRPPGHPSRQTVPYKHSLPTGIRHRRPGGRKTVRGSACRKRRETRSLILGKTVSVHDRCSAARTVKAIITNPGFERVKLPAHHEKLRRTTLRRTSVTGPLFGYATHDPPRSSLRPDAPNRLLRSTSGEVHPAKYIRRPSYAGPDGPCDPGRTSRPAAPIIAPRCAELRPRHQRRAPAGRNGPHDGSRPRSGRRPRPSPHPRPCRSRPDPRPDSSPAANEAFAGPPVSRRPTRPRATSSPRAAVAQRPPRARPEAIRIRYGHDRSRFPLSEGNCRHGPYILPYGIHPDAGLDQCDGPDAADFHLFVGMMGILAHEFHIPGAVGFLDVFDGDVLLAVDVD